MNKMSLSLIVLLLIGLLCSTGTNLIHADSPDPNSLFEMSLEELMDVSIVSASRQAQRSSELSVPVSVITAEDIHYSGLTSIPEILHFASGVDVLPNNRYVYSAGVRGFHDMISDRLLTLVNGKNADSPIIGGVEMHRLPVLVEDIERIEIIRGPGGAAWGANAFSGVINIITKKPEDVQGVLVSSTVNEFGDTSSHIRYGFGRDDWKWRVSVGYDDIHSSDEAGAGKAIFPFTKINHLWDTSAYPTKDFSRNVILDTEAVYDLSDSERLRFGVAYTHAERGDFDWEGYFAKHNGWNEDVRAFLKLEKEFDNGGCGYLQWFGNFGNTQRPALAKYKTVENDLEVQYNFPEMEGHALSVGGNIRSIRITAEPNPRQIQFDHKHEIEMFAGLFLIDRWQVNDRWALEGQFRGDWYSESGQELSVRTSAFYTVDEEKEKRFRFSFARAFRTPYVATRDSYGLWLPVGGPLHAIRLLQADEIKNERTWSLEAGYHERLDETTTFRVDGYYQYFKNMVGYVQLPDPFSMDLAVYQLQNQGDLYGYGIETEVKKVYPGGSISAWYNYHRLQNPPVNRNIRSYGPAKHKAGLTWRAHLSSEWTFNLNYKYADTNPDLSWYGDEPSMNHRLDLTLSRKFADQKGELLFGVSDLLNKTREPNLTVGQLGGHETPGQTFFARLQFNF